MFNLYEAEQLGRIRREEALHDAEIRRLLKEEVEANRPAQPGAVRSIIAGISAAIGRIGHARPVQVNQTQGEQGVPC